MASNRLQGLVLGLGESGFAAIMAGGCKVASALLCCGMHISWVGCKYK